MMFSDIITGVSKSTAELIRIAWIEAERSRIPKEISLELAPLS